MKSPKHKARSKPQEGRDYHGALDVIRKYITYRTQVIEIVNDHAEVIKALKILSKLDKVLLERWSDPNYG